MARHVAETSGDAVVGTEATIDQIAKKMLDQCTHVVLVTDGHGLVGTITSFDLLRVLAQEGPDHPLFHTGYSR